MLFEFVEHGLDLFARHGLQLRHGVTELLHFPGTEVLQDLRCFVLTERQQQHGALFQAVIWVRHRPTP